MEPSFALQVMEVEVKQVAKGVFVGDPLAQAADLGVKPGMVVPSTEALKRQVMKRGFLDLGEVFLLELVLFVVGQGLVALRHLTHLELELSLRAVHVWQVKSVNGEDVMSQVPYSGQGNYSKNVDKSICLHPKIGCIPNALGFPIVFPFKLLPRCL